MDPMEAWTLMDELTINESTYDTPTKLPSKTRGLNEVFDEVDRDVRA